LKGKLLPHKASDFGHSWFGPADQPQRVNELAGPAVNSNRDSAGRTFLARRFHEKLRPAAPRLRSEQTTPPDRPRTFSPRSVEIYANELDISEKRFITIFIRL